MAMVITLVCISLVLTMVTAVLLTAAVRAADSSPQSREIPQVVPAPHFFESAMPLSVQAAPASAVPVEVLLLELERHVRLERAIAESFHLSPTPQSLHVHAASPLMH